MHMKYLMIMWGAAIVYLVVGIYAVNKKEPMRLSFVSRLTEDMVSDIPAYNKEVGKMWCAFSGVLFAGGILIALNPAFSVFFFAIFCVVGIGGAVWWQSKIEERFITEPDK